MNWVDVVIILVVIWFALEGQKRGLLVQLFDILGFLTSLIVSLTFYQQASQILTNVFNVPQIAANPIGFLLMWVLAETVFFTIFADAFRRIFSLERTKPINKWFGFMPAVINALLFSAFVLLFLVSLPINTQIKKEIFAARIAPPLIDQASLLEKPFNDIFGPITKRSLTFFTVAPDEKECQPLGFSTTNVSTDYESEKIMLDLVNKERTKVGVKKIEWNQDIEEIAQNHSKDMLARNYFCHYSPEGLDVGNRLDNTRVEYSTAGENLAYAPDVNRAHSGLMNSPDHKRNILDPAFSKVGIGVIDAGIYGKMFTQVFTN